jgi:hypothetical protein
VFLYVPENSGTHRFTASGDAATLFARRYCNYPQPGPSELGCVRFSAAPDSTADLSLSLTAGEPVFVFVESAWFGGGPFQLAAVPVQ